jgi:hypothetical protein
MAHDPTKQQMGTTPSSSREVDNKNGVIAAGLLVRLTSTKAISTAKADGAPIGVSLGRDMSGIGRTAIVRKGLSVPVRLASGFSPVPGTQVSFDDVTGEAKAAGAGVTGTAATYASGPLTLVEEDGTEIASRAALIDMPGGL